MRCSPAAGRRLRRKAAEGKGGWRGQQLVAWKQIIPCLFHLRVVFWEAFEFNLGFGPFHVPFPPVGNTEMTKTIIICKKPVWKFLAVTNAKKGFLICRKKMILGDTPLPPFWDQNPNINSGGFSNHYIHQSSDMATNTIHRTLINFSISTQTNKQTNKSELRWGYFHAPICGMMSQVMQVQSTQR